jgi:Ca-activated chloride channel family protein
VTPFSLARPDALVPLLGLLALSTAIVVLSWRRARRRMHRLLGIDGLPALSQLARDALIVLALGVTGFAWIGPYVGERTLRVPSSGLDVVVLLDVSRSMSAHDVAPSRLARAQQVAGAVLERLEPGNRAALAAFAGRGVPLTPLTPDVAALTEMLPALDTELIQPQGSDLAAGLAAALDVLDRDAERSEVLLLLSDGEDPLRAATPDTGKLRRRGVRVVAIAFGTDEGAQIPDGEAPLRDALGRIVYTRRDVSRLAPLAEASGGRLFQADAWGEVDLEALLTELRRGASRAGGTPLERRVPARRTTPLAAAAFLLIWFELASPSLPARLRRSLGAAALAIFASTLLVGAPRVRALDSDSGSRAATTASRFQGGWPRDARQLIALGVALAREGNGKEAADVLTEAAVITRASELAALAYFNLGVVELELDRLEAARDAFLDALSLAPDDLEARFNLEWTLGALRVRPPIPESSTGRPTSLEGRGAEPDEPQADASEESVPRPGAALQRSRERSAEPAEKTWEPLRLEEIERWLEAVQDDPSAGWRSAMRKARRPGTQAVPPAW